MPPDSDISDHRAWLGYLQPDGLVVSPPALIHAQVYLDRGVLPELQQRFLPFTTEVELNDAAAVAISDFAAFTRHFLKWPEDCLVGLDPAQPLPDALTVTLPEFGETLAPSFALREAKPKDPDHPWLLLAQVLPLGTNLDDTPPREEAQWAVSPARRFERLLRETRVPIGILANGTQIRLVYAPRGENTGSLTFPVEAMTEVAGRPILGALDLLLSYQRLFAAAADARLPALLEKSRAYQSSVSTALAAQVLDALYELFRGLQAADQRADGALLRDVLEQHPDDVYAGLLTVLLRLVFLLYAEDRGLMPTSSLYAGHYSLHGLFERLRADYERYPDTMDQRPGAWAQLIALFRAVHDGCRHPQMKMPARKGYLFDPERHPFLEGRSNHQCHVPFIADGVVFRVLHNLLLLDGERLSYRTLDVEQIGSVYQTMIGFNVEVANGPAIAIKAAKAKGAPTPIDLTELLAASRNERGKLLKERTEQKLSGQAVEALKTADTIEELLAALEKKIARNSTPYIVPRGGLVLRPSDERRRSGSHYTPRSLTEPIVRTTLRPILERLGEKPTPAQLLDLKICDLAVGSGAFLVETCRQLGDELVKAWHKHGEVPVIPEDEDEVLHARRVVAQRCVYGVDPNQMAVDLAKLSLWLATLARDHPFTFLDHSLRCGDSLVGLTREQLADFHWRDKPGRVLGQEAIERRIRTATDYRKEILEVSDDFTSPGLKEKKLALADEALAPVRRAGDSVIAAFFAADTERARLAKRDEALERHTRFERTFDPALSPDAEIDALRGEPYPVRPFHWEIEFPEVFDRETGGFDAIVGNPPFLGGTMISSLKGTQYRDWIYGAYPESGNRMDLVAYFFRRGFELLGSGRTMGMVATNTIAQGDTRKGGLRYMCRNGGCIYSARRRLKWPGEAAVIVTVVHASRGEMLGPFWLDGRRVERITAYLVDKGGHEDPEPLRANARRSFEGYKISGQGFLFDDADDGATPLADMRRLLENTQNQRRVFPYIGGEEVNDSPSHSYHRFAIDFDDLGLDEAAHWPELLDIVHRKVKPYRDAANRDAHRKRWWQYGEKRPGLRRALQGKTRVLVCSLHQQHWLLAFLPSNLIFSHGLAVFTFERDSALAVLQSRPHEIWARSFASSIKDDLRYTPSDCFETFPFPPNFETNASLDQAGLEYYEHRAALMIQNHEGLTKTYNRFHDPDETSPDILRLRELHDAMDRAILAAYGWTSLRPICAFLLDYDDEDDEEAPSKRKKPWRYRWPDDIRDEVLARLLALNVERAEEERRAGMVVDVGASRDPTSRRGRRKSSRTGALFD